MADDREAFQANRSAGLRARHETREARAVRRRVAEEIAAAIEAEAAADPYRVVRCLSLKYAAKIARRIGAEETP